MEKLNELLRARAAKMDELEKLNAKMSGADYDETAEDNAAYNTLKDAVAALDTKIARAQDVQKLKAAQAVELPGQARDGGRNDDGPRIQRVRSSALKNITFERFGNRAEETAFRFGQFMQASVFEIAKAAAWCRDNGIVLERAASEGVGTAGGFLVPAEFSNMIVDLRDAYGLARRLLTVLPMGRDTLSMPRRTGGLTAYAVGEGSTITQSQMSFDLISLVARKWGILTALSTELDEDAAVNIGDILAGEIAYGFAKTEDTLLFSGDGTGTHHGIRGFRTLFNNGVGSLAGAVDAASGHDTFEEIDATDLARVMAKLPQYVYERGTPRWFCSQVGWALTFQRLLMASGGATIQSLNGRIVREYAGFPVELTPSMPVATTDISDTAMILFGDPNMAATMGGRRGVTVARSTEYLFASDQIAIKGTERIDMNIHDIGGATEAGPMVALMGE